MLDKNEALWLPKGSVRAILAFLMIGGVIVGAFMTLPTEYFTALVGLAGTASGFYFGNKQQGRS